jgi:flagellar protein FliS
MAYNMAYSAYKKTGVQTASRGKLVVMLYDEAVRQLGIAESFFEADGKVKPRNMDKLNAAILKTQEIITELIVSLDMTNGGNEIARNLLSLYNYFNRELFDANITQNKEKLSFVRSMMNELRGAWAQAERTTQTPVADLDHAVSING